MVMGNTLKVITVGTMGLDPVPIYIYIYIYITDKHGHGEHTQSHHCGYHGP